MHVCSTGHDPLERRICKLAAIGVSTRADDDDTPNKTHAALSA